MRGLDRRSLDGRNHPAAVKRLALALAFDAFMPATTSTAHVDRHAMSEQWRMQTRYTLYFVGCRVDECSVGYSAYTTLKDGDAVTLTTSRVFKTCEVILRDDEVIEKPGAGRWLVLVVIAFLLAGGFGL